SQKIGNRRKFDVSSLLLDFSSQVMRRAAVTFIFLEMLAATACDAGGVAPDASHHFDKANVAFTYDGRYFADTRVVKLPPARVGGSELVFENEPPRRMIELKSRQERTRRPGRYY